MNRKFKKSIGGHIGTGLLRIYLILFSITIIFPVCWTIWTSFKTTQEFFAEPFGLPVTINLDNFVRAWEMASVGEYFMTSVKISVICVPILAIVGSMVAYACTRLKLKIGNLTSGIFMMGLFIPTVLCIVPMFLQMRSAKLIDNHFGLILLMLAVNMPFSTYVLCGVFRTMPHELEEAAVIDGCNHFQIFFKVLFPIAKSGVATISIFNFLSVWNEYVLARTMIMTPVKNTLPVGLVNLQATTNHQADWTALFAGMVIVMIPTMVIYLIFQKYITSGLTAGAVKG